MKPRSHQHRRRLVRTLVVCFLIACLWPLSYLADGRLRADVGRYRFDVDSGTGWCGFAVDSPRDLAALSAPVQLSLNASFLNSVKRESQSFTRVYPQPGEYRFYCPTWTVALLAGVVAMAAVGSFIRNGSKIKSAYCDKCGYDLRASPHRCPECGTFVKHSTNRPKRLHIF